MVKPAETGRTSPARTGHRPTAQRPNVTAQAKHAGHKGPTGAPVAAAGGAPLAGSPGGAATPGQPSLAWMSQYVKGLDTSKTAANLLNWKAIAEADQIVFAGVTFTKDADGIPVKRMHRLGPVRDQIKFAILRASVGDHTDKDFFDRNWSELKARDLRFLRGAYHFMTFAGKNVSTAEEQLKAYFNVVGSFDKILPPILDIEFNDTETIHWLAQKGNVGKAIEKIRTWLDIAQIRTGRKPIIYTGQGAWDKLVAGDPRNDRKMFGEYPLWVAHYMHPTMTEPKPLPDSWSEWLIWQCVGFQNTTIQGVITHDAKQKKDVEILLPVDLNLFKGTYFDLIKLAGRTGLDFM